MQQIIEKYLAVFNEEDPAARAERVRDVFAPDFSYTDPHASIRGVDALVAFVTQARKTLPGARFALAGPIDAHHDQARFQWSVTVEGAEQPLAIGFDVVTLEDGRIRDVYGFVDRGRADAVRSMVERYLVCWNEDDSDVRLAALRELFTGDATYVDPIASVRGPEGLGGLIGGVRAQLPGVVFVLGAPPESHHDQVRFTWHAIAPGASDPVASGFDLAVLAGDRIRAVHGFVDRAPA